MSTPGSSLATTGYVLVTACIIGTVSGITIIFGPMILTALIVAVSAKAGEFYAGVFLGVLIGVLFSVFTAFLVYRVYRLQQAYQPQMEDGVMYQQRETDATRSQYDYDGYQQVTDGDPPWFDMYLFGCVTGLLTSLVLPGPIPTLAGALLGSLVSARLFANA